MFNKKVIYIIFKIIVMTKSFVAGDIKIEKVADPVIHGEGPHWDCEKQVLYFVDITNQTVNKYDPNTKTVNQVYIDGGPVSLVIPDKLTPDQFIIGRGRDIVSVKWDGVSSKPSALTVLSSVDDDKPQNRFNDGKADASGRLWAGTMGPENPDLKPLQGSFFSFDWPDNFSPHKHLSPVSVSNGLGWNDKNDLMYYIDSPTRVINVFDFDITEGKISNRRTLFSLDRNNITGFPDGMTIDEQGNLWVAVFQGSCVLHIDAKDGELIQKINFPVTQVTSCAFGGENLTDLYVTTSRVNINDKELQKQPLAGALFKVTGLQTSGQVKSNRVIYKF